MVSPVTGTLNIDTLWFRHGPINALFTQLTNFQIRMGHSNLTDPGVQFNANFNIGSAQTVLSASNYVYTPLAGAFGFPADNWTFIALQTPFEYNFIDNLCVEFSFSASSGAIAGNYANNGGAPVTQYAATSNATGVAKPSAHGQAITMTAIALAIDSEIE